MSRLQRPPQPACAMSSPPTSKWPVPSSRCTDHYFLALCISPCDFLRLLCALQPPPTALPPLPLLNSWLPFKAQLRSSFFFAEPPLTYCQEGADGALSPACRAFPCPSLCSPYFILPWTLRSSLNVQSPSTRLQASGRQNHSLPSLYPHPWSISLKWRNPLDVS